MLLLMIKKYLLQIAIKDKLTSSRNTVHTPYDDEFTFLLCFSTTTETW